MDFDNIAIFGGSGFVGSGLSSALTAQGKRLKVFTRSREHTRELWPLPSTEIVEMDVYDEGLLSEHLNGCGAVINLVGILNERAHDGTGFRKAHTEFTRSITRSAIAAGVTRYLHMSALNADPFGPSYYLRTKGEAENAALAAHDEGLMTTVFRPSVIFGPNDEFFNRFDRLLTMSPPVFPLACAAARFQPVYIGDVVLAFVKSLADRNTFGQRYDLGGPDVMTLLEIVRLTAKLGGHKTLVVPLGKALSKLQANVLEYVPGKPFSRDNYASTTEDSVCTNDDGLANLGISPPTSVEEIVPGYLGHRHEKQRYYDMRAAARRDS